jgi:hypothetical protein
VDIRQDAGPSEIFIIYSMDDDQEENNNDDNNQEEMDEEENEGARWCISIIIWVLGTPRSILP